MLLTIFYFKSSINLGSIWQINKKIAVFIKLIYCLSLQKNSTFGILSLSIFSVNTSYAIWFVLPQLTLKIVPESIQKY